MDKDMETVLVSHSDLDGYGNNIIIQTYLGHIRSFNIGYSDLETVLVALPDNIQLIITDLSIPERTSPMLERFAHVIIIDHHITTQWAVGWAESTGNEAIVDTSRCATWLTYEYMKSVYGFGSEKMTCWARLIDDYDRYVLQYPESRRLNVLFNITADPIRFVRDGMEKHPETLLNRESDDIDYYLEQQRKYIDKSTMFVLNYKPQVVMTFAERHKSAMAEIAIAEGGVDLFYGVDLHSMTVSIRSSVKSKIDCTKVAKMINPDGGGHRNASGASISNWCVGWNNVEVGTFCMPLSFPSRDLPTYSEESE